jgi:hypothetical protein
MLGITTNVNPKTRSNCLGIATNVNLKESQQLLGIATNVSLKENQQPSHKPVPFKIARS